MEFKTQFGMVDVDIQHHYSNQRKAILLMQEGGAVAVLSVNLHDQILLEGEFFIKTWSENYQIAQDALASGLFIDTGKRVKAGYCEASVWRFK